MGNIYLKTIQENKRSILLLTFGAIGLVLIDFLLSCQSIYTYFYENYSAYLQGIMTNIVGALIVLIIIDSRIKEKDKNDEKNNIISQLRAINQVLDPLFKKYIEYSKMITEIGIINGKECDINRGFPFKALKNIFRMPSLLIMDDSFKSGYHYFFENIDKITDTIKHTLYNIDFKSHPDFQPIQLLFMEYLEQIDAINPKDAILADAKYFINGRPKEKSFGITLQQMFDTMGDRPNPARKQHNIMTKYYILYHQMNFMLDVIGKYNDFKKKIGL